MISRVAKNLYNLNRYVENALFISRLLSMQMGQLSEGSSQTISMGWDWIFKSLRIEPPGGILLNADSQSSDDFCLADAYTLADYATFEKEQINSILNSFQIARENASLSREHINNFMWSQLNTTYLQIQSTKMSDIWPRRILGFYNEIIQSIYIFYGFYSNFLYKGEGFEFLNLGRFSKQLQTTSALLETHINFIMGWKEKEKELISLLLYCGAFDFYRSVYTLDMTINKVINFIIEHPKAPCSLYYSIDQIEQSIKRIDPSGCNYPFTKIYKSVKNLKTEISYSLKQDSLSQFLEDINVQSNEIHDNIVETYF